MDSKSVAAAIRKDNSLVVHRLSDSVYWAGSIHAMVKMDQTEFNEFRVRYNSYKNTPEIPEKIKADKPIGYISGEWKDHGPDVRPVIQGPARYDDLKNIFFTNFKFTHKDREIVLYTINGIIGGYDNKYSRIINQFSYSMAQNHLDAIRAYDKSDLKALIMPLRRTACSFSDHFSILVNAKLPSRREK